MAWTQMDYNYRITERPGLEQTWKIIWFQQFTQQVLVLQQHPEWSCKSSRNSGEMKEESPFYTSLPFTKLWCSDISCSTSLLAGRASWWSRGGSGWSSDSNSSWCASEKPSFQIQTQYWFISWSMKIYPIQYSYFQRAGFCFGWIFALNLCCSNSSCIFNYWHRLRHWILALSNSPWQAALWINKGETIPCFLWSAMLKLHS